jgi:hypothetical protein
MPGLDSFVVALLHFDGPDGGVGFPDATGKRNWAAANSTQLDADYFRFGISSGLFGTAHDYITTPDHADFAFGTNEWTIDFWFKTAMTGQGFIWYQGAADGTSTTVALMIRMNGTKISFTPDYQNYSSNHWIESTAAVNDNAWHHCACLRQGTVFRLYIDGVATGTPWDGSTYSMLDSNQPNYIGTMGPTYNKFIGWLDEFRVSKGIARWTANSNPPGLPYGVNPQTYLINRRDRFRTTGISLG